MYEKQTKNKGSFNRVQWLVAPIVIGILAICTGCNDEFRQGFQDGINSTTEAHDVTYLDDVINETTLYHATDSPMEHYIDRLEEDEQPILMPIDVTYSQFSTAFQENVQNSLEAFTALGYEINLLNPKPSDTDNVVWSLFPDVFSLSFMLQPDTEKIYSLSFYTGFSGEQLSDLGLEARSAISLTLLKCTIKSLDSNIHTDDMNDIFSSLFSTSRSTSQVVHNNLRITQIPLPAFGILMFSIIAYNEDSPGVESQITTHDDLIVASDNWFTIASDDLRVEISIPPTWGYDMIPFDDYYGTAFIELVDEVDNSAQLLIWDSTVDDPYIIINQFSSQKQFFFDDGSIGYQLHNENSIIWFQFDSHLITSLFHGGNSAIFTDNEDIITSIVKTLTTINARALDGISHASATSILDNAARESLAIEWLKEASDIATLGGLEILDVESDEQYVRIFTQCQMRLSPEREYFWLVVNDYDDIYVAVRVIAESGAPPYFASDYHRYNFHSLDGLDRLFDAMDRVYASYLITP